jgi:hypothetical protein
MGVFRGRPAVDRYVVMVARKAKAKLQQTKIVSELR